VPVKSYIFEQTVDDAYKILMIVDWLMRSHGSINSSPPEIRRLRGASVGQVEEGLACFVPMPGRCT
jgi:hypothetical protein